MQMINNRLLLPGSVDLMEDNDAGEDYEHLYKKTGKKAKKDWDGDGEVEDDADEYAGVKDKKIEKAMDDEDGEGDESENKKKKSSKEESYSYSDWRSELSEQLGKDPNSQLVDPAIDDPTETTKQINGQVKEKKVNNKIVVGPTIQENIQRLQTTHLAVVLEFVVDHFNELGYGGKDVVDIIEEVGSFSFYEYLLDSMNDGLYESHVTRRKFSPMNFNIIKEHLSDCIMNSGFQEWVDDLVAEGYDLADYDLNALRKHYISEKAVSQSQQQLFGLALAVKRGEVPRSKVSKEVLKISDGVSTAEIRKFAKTKHSGLPETK
jgi:hypothetical protein